ncbi:unnamed protein product [Polarella glacialis]|uniref:SGNH hydrolase-type esterase domain-containing protein n=1 Tax=Polarella glacialis TaxID=89957 RepID=A0A813IY25_POLGL|nr:unnamed protein product [Polarella glacialis]CAE8657345.1 unnamed protein product [Polarella glacialis]
MAGTSVILAIGDSLTRGGFGSILYTEFLSDMLGVGVENAGVWGELTEQMLGRLEARLGAESTCEPPGDGPDCEPKSLQLRRPSVVLVLGGTNDLSRRTPLSETVGNLQAMHELAASYGAVVGVLAVPLFLEPRIGWAKNRKAINDELVRLQATYEFPSFLVNLSQVPSTHLYDGLHFKSEGYWRFAELVAEQLRQFR